MANTSGTATRTAPSGWISYFIWAAAIIISIVLSVWFTKNVSSWIIPALFGAIVPFGAVRMYRAFTTPQDADDKS